MDYKNYLKKSLESQREAQADWSIPTYKNFKDFDNLIHSGEKRIVLDSNYLLAFGEASEYGEGIELDVDGLVIDANNHSISARKKTRIFNITGKGITIRNLLLKDGLREDKGGAIYNSGEASLIGCVVKDNRLHTYKFIDCYGGAIYNCAEAQMDLIRCELFDNHSKDYGGAIQNCGKMNIEFSSLHNNKVIKGGGGAIRNGGDLTVTRSNLSRNEGRYGGAIYTVDFLDISRSVLNDNRSRMGAAIFNSWGDADVSGCVFSSNASYDLYQVGGAVYTGDGTTFNIIKSKFLHNRATRGSGGAIAMREAKVAIADSTFEDNEAETGGGAVSNYSARLQILDCIFAGNVAGSYGGAIINYPETDLHISGSLLDGNTAEERGGAIYSREDFKVDECIFKDNSPDDVFREDIGT